MRRFFPSLFFDLSNFKHRELFSNEEPVWDALRNLKNYFNSLSLGKIECEIPASATLVNPQRISIGKGTVVQPGAYIEGPCLIGENCEVRHGAYIRPFVLTGDHCVIGHATEAKCAIFLNGAKAPHFNYVGDSIIGSSVNLGAGVICANLRLDHKVVSVRINNELFDSGLKKFGAVIGDHSQIGCNAVLNPGLLLKKGSFIPSCESVRFSNVPLEAELHE